MNDHESHEKNQVKELSKLKELSKAEMEKVQGGGKGAVDVPSWIKNNARWWS